MNTVDVSTTPERFVSGPKLAARLGISTETLKTWRTERGLPSIKLGHRTLMYDVRDVDRWLEGHK